MAYPATFDAENVSAMRRIVVLLPLLLMTALESCAQKELYDVVLYSLPAGWKKEVHPNGLQLSAINNKTGEYLAVVISQSTISELDAKENFTGFWTKLVKGTVTVTDEPTMLAPEKEKDWEIISGWAHYIDGANKGMVTQLTATGYGRVVNLIVLTNTEKFQVELGQFLHSLELKKPDDSSLQGTAETTGTNSSPLAGKIWEGTVTEKFVGAGTMTGYHTGGFFTWQYKFNADGTYSFVYVGASAYTETNQLQYETGRYAVNGQQLTITPTSGANEEWSVTGGPVKIAAMNDIQIRNIKEHWGKRVKTEKRKLEKITYPFTLAYSQGDQTNVMTVQYKGHTEREGNGNSTRFRETLPAKSVAIPDAVRKLLK